MCIADKPRQMAVALIGAENLVESARRFLPNDEHHANMIVRACYLINELRKSVIECAAGRSLEQCGAMKEGSPT